MALPQQGRQRRASDGASRAEQQYSSGTHPSRFCWGIGIQVIEHIGNSCSFGRRRASMRFIVALHVTFSLSLLTLLMGGTNIAWVEAKNGKNSRH
jgi:hypothetical protein